MAMILGALIAAALLILVAIMIGTAFVIYRRRDSNNSNFFGCGSDKRQSG